MDDTTPRTPTYYTYAGTEYPAEKYLGATRLRIRRLAEKLGWELVNRETDHHVGLFEEWRVTHPGGRTRTYVAISYAVNGAVTHASTPKTYIHGRGKAERIETFLREYAQPRNRKAA